MHADVTSEKRSQAPIRTAAARMATVKRKLTLESLLPALEADRNSTQMNTLHVRACNSGMRLRKSRAVCQSVTSSILARCELLLLPHGHLKLRKQAGTADGS